VDYSSAISSVIPGTFVPDLGKTDETPSVSAIPGDDSGATSFKDTIKKMLTDVNDKVNESDQDTRDLATGATDDIQKVTTSVEEANLSLSYMMSIRTKLLDLYSEVSRLQV
jgi:flagellar hook-basal body complex protein FliE